MLTTNTAADGNGHPAVDLLRHVEQHIRRGTMQTAVGGVKTQLQAQALLDGDTRIISAIAIDRRRVCLGQRSVRRAN
ncbi:MAG: hypothetical protein ACOCXZ_03605 [Chloroflexota bacterium]